MYIQGMSTRDVEKVIAEFGLDSLSSTQVSRAAAMLDEDRGAQRSTHGAIVPWARSATCSSTPATRRCGSAGSFAMLRSSQPSESMERGGRSVLGVSVALFEAEVHWRSFLDDLVRRGMRGVEFVTSDHHPGRVAQRLELPARPFCRGLSGSRCQLHLAQNAIHHAPTMAIRKRIGADLRGVGMPVTAPPPKPN